MPKAAGRKQITDAMLRRIRPPRDGRLEIGDAHTQGLVLRVTPRGVMSWSYCYKVPGERHTVTRGKTVGTVVGGLKKNGDPRKGTQHRVTLGQYPAVGVADARAKASELLQTVLKGRDPRQERRELNQHRTSNTFEAVMQRFVDLQMKPNVKSWANAERVLRLHVRPEWDGMPLLDIRRRHIHDLLDDLVADDSIGTAREVRKHLHRLFEWAVDRELVPGNPVHGLIRDELSPNEDAGRALSDDELRAAWQAADGLGYPFGPWYRLLMLTGQRRADWALARRSEIDARSLQLEIPAARYKGKRDHIVPLGTTAWEIVEGLPVWPNRKANDHFIFSGTGGESPISGFSYAKERLDAAMLARLRRAANDDELELAPFRVHDFRVTCKTRLAALGIKEEVRDAVLGHAKEGLEKTYNKHDYLNEKREALALYAAHVLKVAV